ncbi:hypothetical protein [Tissierella sp.]|uniref:hypothetical protein n=1 Tax=Tissierella sp. TaxID=41274 RepID=UPI0028559342|nr:hypothetical protein [Tissierella sp.]MDR7856085.1 hypothetical protein [Tissierella sp.]
MSYAEKFIYSKGQDCVIHREPNVETKVSKKRSTKASRDLGIREGYWEGLIPNEVDLLSGEIITIKDNKRDAKYLVQSTNYDPQSMQTAFFSAKCNVTMRHMRFVDNVDDDYNPIQQWQDVDPDNVNIDCYGEAINQRLRQENPGLLESTIYILQIPKILGVKELDRIVFDGKNYQASSINDIGMSGILQVQLELDFRP